VLTAIALLCGKAQTFIHSPPLLPSSGYPMPKKKTLGERTMLKPITLQFAVLALGSGAWAAVPLDSISISRHPNLAVQSRWPA
jgi:hypothetical protein